MPWQKRRAGTHSDNKIGFPADSDRKSPFFDLTAKLMVAQFFVRSWGKKMIISLVDDDEDFCRTAQKWAQRSDIELLTFPNPPLLIDYLRKRPQKNKQKLIVLLDLDFHGDKQGGLRVLSEMKSPKNQLRKIPVIIYSNSRNVSEINKSYLRLANSFVWKGHGGKQRKRFTELVNFWKSVAALPNAGETIA